MATNSKKNTQKIKLENKSNQIRIEFPENVIETNNVEKGRVISLTNHKRNLIISKIIQNSHSF